MVLAKTDPKLEIDGVRLPHEQTFKYLGVLIGCNGVKTAEHIQRLASNAQKAHTAMRACGLHCYGPDTRVMM